MRTYLRWSIGLGLLGSFLQFYWLTTIDALSRQAGVVTITTTLLGLLTALWFEPIARRKNKRAKLLAFMTCVFAGALAALSAFVLAEGIDRADAIQNSIKRHSVEFVVLNAVGLGGWLVGASYGFAVFLSRR